jgi:hypothetical protein
LNPVCQHHLYFIKRHGLSPIDEGSNRIMKSKEIRYPPSTPSG